MSGHKCGDCQTCPKCGRSAWCEGDRILVIPCEHHGYCGDCNAENCGDCNAEVEADMEYVAAALNRSFERVGDPFRQDTPADDPFAPIGDTYRTHNTAWREAVRRNQGKPT